MISVHVRCGLTTEYLSEDWFDCNFAKTEIAHLLHTGENDLTLETDCFQNPEVLYGNVTESRRNCLCFDTKMEAACLIGDFRVLTPGTFSFEKEWHGADCPAFCERYTFVKHGI